MNNYMASGDRCNGRKRRVRRVDVVNKWHNESPKATDPRKEICQYLSYSTNLTAKGNQLDISQIGMHMSLKYLLLSVDSWELLDI